MVNPKICFFNWQYVAKKRIKKQPPIKKENKRKKLERVKREEEEDMSTSSEEEVVCVSSDEEVKDQDQDSDPDQDQESNLEVEVREEYIQPSMEKWIPKTSDFPHLGVWAGKAVWTNLKDNKESLSQAMFGRPRSAKSSSSLASPPGLRCTILDRLGCPLSTSMDVASLQQQILEVQPPAFIRQHLENKYIFFIRSKNAHFIIYIGFCDCMWSYLCVCTLLYMEWPI